MAVVKFSSVEQANLLKVPRILNCDGSARRFPGQITCPICRKHKGIKCTFGRIAGCLSDIKTLNEQKMICRIICPTDTAPHDKIDEFSCWAVARKSAAWREFEHHMNRQHLRDPRKFDCPRCGVALDSFEARFEHSFRLMEIGHLCMLCSYPFSLDGSAWCHYRSHHEHNMSVINKATSFEEFMSSFDVVKEKPSTNSSGCHDLRAVSRPETSDSTEKGNSDNQMCPASTHSDSEDQGETSSRVPNVKRYYVYTPGTHLIMCEKCGREYPSLTLFKNHFKSAHVRVSCRKCSKHFYNLRFLTIHLNTECPFTTKHRASPKAHKLDPSSSTSASLGFGGERSFVDASSNVDVKAAKRACNMTHLDLRPPQIASCSDALKPELSPISPESSDSQNDDASEMVKEEPLDTYHCDLEIKQDLEPGEFYCKSTLDFQSAMLLESADLGNSSNDGIEPSISDSSASVGYSVCESEALPCIWNVKQEGGGEELNAVENSKSEFVKVEIKDEV